MRKKDDNEQIENQILSMLEGVLKEDNEEEFETRRSLNNSFYYCPENNLGFSQNPTRVEKKARTTDPKPSNYWSLFAPIPVISKCKLFGQSELSNMTNHNSESTFTSKNEKTNEDIPPHIYLWNEYDEILESKIRPKAEIDFDSFSLLNGKFLNVLCTQNGSRVLQKALIKSKYSIVIEIFHELKDNLQLLMVDQYANYFCPKFYLLLQTQERQAFLNVIVKQFHEIAKSKIGTHPLQLIIDCFKTEQEERIIAAAAEENLIKMCLDVQANHVIEKILDSFKESSIPNIYTEIILNFELLAQNPNGLGVCKKIITCSLTQTTLKQIIAKLNDNLLTLVQNVYGNYILQFALDTFPAEICIPIVKQLKDQIYLLSMQKYSSNVIEKLFDSNYDKVIDTFIKEIGLENRAMEMMKSPYGNYVLQKALKLSRGLLRNKLISIVVRDIKKLVDKKLIKKWKSIVEGLNSLNKNDCNPNNEPYIISYPIMNMDLSPFGVKNETYLSYGKMSSSTSRTYLKSNSDYNLTINPLITYFPSLNSASRKQVL